jgi:peptidyl-prolyl cis-trans isomerase SurA
VDAMIRTGIFLFVLILTISGFVYSDNGKTPFQYRLRQVFLMPDVSKENETAIYKKALSCIEMAKKGADFTELAKKYSEEPGAESSGGNLGYFKRENMVKPFSDAVFSMKIGEISNPVKTVFGYHIIKLLDIKGDTRNAAHILFFLVPDSNDTLRAFEKLNNIRDSLIKEKNRDKIYREANSDSLLKALSGYMVWLKPSEMLPEFEEAIKNLKPGEISKPFVSVLGFHIVEVDSINYDSGLVLEGVKH